MGILKATGWQTDEILLRAGVENLLIVAGGFSISLLLAFVWLAWFNGFWIAGVFPLGCWCSTQFPGAVSSRTNPLLARTGGGIHSCHDRNPLLNLASGNCGTF